ncbi:glycosyltransferase [Tistrella mobilis]|uniref:glycosyltransferase n=1 Tax=Tistrella mobilis TaxID=171437 RepID=UPI0035576590
MARLLLLTAGTEGDVRPFVNLAARLVARGHEVGLAAPAGDAEMVAESGARHLKLAIDFRDMARQGQAHAAGLPGLIDRLARPGTLTRVADALFETTARGRSFRPDAIIAHPKYTGAADLAQALQVPWAQVALLPCIAPTAVVPNAALFARDMGPWANRASYCLTPCSPGRWPAAPIAGGRKAWACPPGARHRRPRPGWCSTPFPRPCCRASTTGARMS